MKRKWEKRQGSRNLYNSYKFCGGKKNNANDLKIVDNIEKRNNI